MATFAIGDIHGHLGALERVIRLVEAEAEAADTVVFLGDYIDRGHRSADCIESILRFSRASPATVVALLGNHEDWLLRAHRDPTDHCWWLATSAAETVGSYDPEAAVAFQRCARAAGHALYGGRAALPYSLLFEAMWPGHLDFLRSLRPFHRTADAVCVHGGLDPDAGGPDVQTTRALLYGTNAFQDRYEGADVLVYGHWGNAIPQSDGRAEPLVIGRTIGIDSIKHGTLTALKLPDGLVLQSDGSRSWVYSSMSVRKLREGGGPRLSSASA
jgi:serine/threonine protein phosphatase 1